MSSPKAALQYPNLSTLLYLFTALTSLLPHPSQGNNLRESVTNNYRYSPSQSFNPADSLLSCYSGASLRRSPSFAAHVHRHDKMRCSHFSRVVATLKSAHPDWSLAAVQSAIMTTAKPLDDDDGSTDSLSVGSIQLDQDRAMDPGLIYNMISSKEHLCSLNNNTRISDRHNCSNNPYSRDLNRPSFVAFYDNKKTSSSSSSTVVRQRFRRTVTNVGRGGGRAMYKVDVVAPRGSWVTVHPKTLVFVKKYEKKSYTLTLKYVKGKNERVSKGWISWNEVHGRHKVMSPIVIAPRLLGSA